MKKYIEAIEGKKGSDRIIKYFVMDDIKYIPQDCYATGLDEVDGENYLRFVCKVNGQVYMVYCDDPGGVKRYFVVK